MAKYGFISGGAVFLERCPKCGRENYAPSVSHGVCVWCGYNANKDSEFIKTLEEEK